jgi:hypothetical protein
MQWLNHTTAVTDLTANPWNCDCSVLLEVWREMKHKLTFQCASPRELEGKSWDEMEVFCSPVAGDNPTNVGGLSVLTTALIVTGVLMVCAIVGGLMLVKVLKKRRNIPNNSEYDKVYDPGPSQFSDHLYDDGDSGKFSNSVHSYTDVRSDSNMEQDTVM